MFQQQAVPGLFDTLAPRPPTVQAPTAVPGLFSTPPTDDGHSATIRQAQGNLQSFLADPVKAMTYATLTGTAGQGPQAMQHAWQSPMDAGGPGMGGIGGNHGLAEPASTAQSFGGFLGDTLGNIASIANPSLVGLVSLGYNVANNNPTFGIKGLFDAIMDTLGLRDPFDGIPDMGDGHAPGDGFGGQNGMAGDPGSGTGDPGSAFG